VVGEIRTEQRVALTFFQAMGTGHTAYTTIHADSIETVLSRLQNPPLSIPTQMLQDLDIVSIQRQTFIGDRRVRRNDSTVELFPSEENPNDIDVNFVFEWDPRTDTHEQQNDSRVLAEIAHDRGWDEADLEFELGRRQRVLAYLVENDITDYAEVAGTIHMYSKDPEFVMDAVDSETVTTEELLDSVDGGSEDADEAEVADPVVDTEEVATWESLVREAEREAALADVPDVDVERATDDGSESPDLGVDLDAIDDDSLTSVADTADPVEDGEDGEGADGVPFDETASNARPEGRDE
jgi:flagellar protein FlaI